MATGLLGAASSRLVLKQNTSGHATLPGLSGTAVTTGATNSTYGGWFQVTSATGAEYYLVGVAARITVSNTAVRGPVHFSVGIGGSGSEIQIGEFVLVGSEGGAAGTSPTFFQGGHKDLTVPLRIAGGTRLCVNVAIGTTNAAVALATWLTVIPYANVEGN